MAEPIDARGHRVGHKAVTVSLSLDEWESLKELHRRVRRLNDEANKSTPFRAGIRYLMGLDDHRLQQLLAETPTIPRGPRRSTS